MADPSGSTVLFRRTPRDLPRRELKAFAGRLAAEVGEVRPFTCLFTDDKELRRLNREFLGHDYATDVLSFPAAEGEPHLGEMAISVERAREQAGALGHSLTEELCILMLHGVLHLKGMDHEADRGAMARAEKRWRKQFGLPTGLIERARR